MATRLQDLQAILPRTEEVAKLQQTQHQAPQVNQEQIAAQFQSEKQVKRQKTQEAQGKDQAKIRDEDIPSRQRRYASTRRKTLRTAKAAEAKKTASEPVAIKTGNRIDLKA